MSSQPATPREPAPRGLAPPLHELGLGIGSPSLEERLRRFLQLRRPRVLLDGDPTDDRVGDLGRENGRELGSHVVGAGDHDPRSVEPSERPLELRSDGLVVLVRDILDVALEPGLRPASLIVTTRRVFGAVDDLVEPAVSQREHAAQLPVDDGDEGAVATADQRYEGSEQEVVGHPDRVGHGGRQREHVPDVVEPGCEHGQPM